MLLRYFASIIYVQVSPELLTVRNVSSGKSVSEVPEIAIDYDPKPRIVGVGKEAHSHKFEPSVKVFNPFAHPRSMVSDFTLGEQTLKAFLARVKGRSFITFSPKVIMHLLGEPSGGFTQVEIRAFQEMAIGAGASQVKVWQGHNLSDHELLSGKFPRNGEVLS